MLLHSPPLADGWNSFLGALRQGLTLRGEIRELVILRIAVLNDAPYEWDSHVAVARREGLKDAALRALRSLHPESSPALSPVQKRVLALTDSMTRVVQVPDATFDPLRSDFTATELVELVATIAAYNMVSRFAVALNINERGEQS
jgi:alkylhydroperoxidase family enzyme